jgi:hypothetical protein
MSAKPSREERKRSETQAERIQKAGKAFTEKISREDQLHQVAAVVERLLKKIHTWEDGIEWIMTQAASGRVGDDLALLLLSKIREKNPVDTDSSYCFTAIVNKRPLHERLAGLSQYGSAISNVVEKNEFREWMKELCPIWTDQIEDNSGWAEAKAARHNNEMHSLNGNTQRMEFPDNMSDILAHPETKPVYQEKMTLAGHALSDPLTEVQQQSGILNVQGVNLSNVPIQMPIRGGIVTDANAYNNTNDLNHPEALLYPRQVRNGAAAALIDSTQELQLMGVGTLRRQNKAGLTLSSYGSTVAELVMKQGNIRPDQLTAYGFYTTEMAGLIKTEGDTNGDSMVGPFLNLKLYSLAIGWDQGANNLPLSSEPGKFDAFTVLQNNPNCTIDYNNGTDVFDENCGGAGNPFFPFSGAANRIAFHFTNQTVPAGRTPLYVRAALLMQNDRGDNTINFMLLAMALANYPCGLHNVLISTQDTAGGHMANQAFTPLSECVHVDGFDTLDFVIPVLSGTDPRQINTYALANNHVVVQPSAGPTAWGALGADQFLDVNAIGQAYVDYSLADFMGSWFALPNSPIDIMTISRFSKQLAELTCRSKDMAFANELAITLSVRYPAMFEHVLGAPTVPNVNSDASVAMQNFFAQIPHQVNGDLPEDQTLHDFYIPELNPLYFTKTMTGMYLGVNDGGVYPPPNYIYDGSSRALQYSIHTARDYAIAGEYIFQYHRQSQELWNNAFTQSPMVKLVNTLRKYFVSAQLGIGEGGAILKSDAGHVAAALHAKVNGEAPAQDMWGYTVWSYMNAPRVGFRGVWSTALAELTTPIPCILPDVWSQLFSKKRTLAFSPFISPLKKMIGIQEKDAQVTALGAGGYTIPANVQSQAREIGLNTIPLANDVEVFNARWVWHVFNSSLYTLDNNIWAISTVASTNVVGQKFVQNDYTIQNLTTASVPSAKTNWMPYNTSTGLRLLVGVTAANNASLMTQIMVGRAFTGLTTWVFNKVSVMPNVVVGADGNEDDGIWDDTTASGKDSSTSSPVSMAEVTQM